MASSIYWVKLTLGIRDRLLSALEEVGLSMSVLEDMGPKGCIGAA
jgi:hypothetical protein